MHQQFTNQIEKSKLIGTRSRPTQKKKHRRRIINQKLYLGRRIPKQETSLTRIIKQNTLQQESRPIIKTVAKHIKNIIIVIIPGQNPPKQKHINIIIDPVL